MYAAQTMSKKNELLHILSNHFHFLRMENRGGGVEDLVMDYGPGF